MNVIPRFRSTKALCFLFLTLSSPFAFAIPDPTADELLTALQQSLAPREGRVVDPRLGQSIEVVRSALASERFADVEQYLTGLRGSLPGTNDTAAALIDQLRLVVHAQIAKADGAREAELNAILQDASAKFAAHAPGAEFDTLLTRLAVLGPSSRNQYNEPTAQKIEVARSFLARYQDYLLQSEANNIEQASNALNEVIQLSSRLAIVPRSQLVALQTEVSNRPSTNSPAAARWEILRKTVESTIDSAKSATDLDAVLVEITKTVPSDNNRGYNHVNGNQVEALRRFIRRWQDYLSQLEGGNTNAAQTSLRELATDNGSETFYPRSRILARLNGKSMPVANPAGRETLVTPEDLTLETLDQFAKANAANQISIPSGMRDFANNDLATELNRLLAAAHQLKLGNPQTAVYLVKSQNTLPRLGPYALAFARIQQTLILQALPSYIHAPTDLKILNGETPDRYLERVIQRACKMKDWPLASRAAEANQLLLTSLFSTGVMSAEADGFRLLLIGINQETAGEWTSAARSYMTALRTTGANLPVEEIGARLKGLKASHMKEYEIAQSQPNPQNSGPYIPPLIYSARNPPEGPMPGMNLPPHLRNFDPRTMPPPPQAQPAPPLFEPPTSPSSSPPPVPPKASPPAPKE